VDGERWDNSAAVEKFRTSMTAATRHFSTSIWRHGGHGARWIRLPRFRHRQKETAIQRGQCLLYSNTSLLNADYSSTLAPVAAKLLDSPPTRTAYAVGKIAQSLSLIRRRRPMNYPLETQPPDLSSGMNVKITSNFSKLSLQVNYTFAMGFHSLSSPRVSREYITRD